MASGPPEDVAKTRWMALQVIRVAGVIMVIVALLGLEGAVPMPDVAAYVILVAGLVDVFFVPILLSRAWSSRER